MHVLSFYQTNCVKLNTGSCAKCNLYFVCIQCNTYTISTVPFLQFIVRNWSSHSPYALSFSPLLPRSKPFPSVVSQPWKNFSWSACGHLLQDLNHLFFVLPQRLYANLALALALLSALWRVASRLGLCEISLLLHTSEGVGWHHHSIK